MSLPTHGIPQVLGVHAEGADLVTRIAVFPRAL
jgi:hypothetical protein